MALQYVGQQHRERQGRGKKGEAGEGVAVCRIGVHTSTYLVWVILACFPFTGCAGHITPSRRPTPSLAADVSAEGDSDSQAEEVVVQ